MKKKILLIPLVLLLAALLLPACAPAPVEVPAEIAELEREVAAEKAKTVAAQAETAAAQAETAAAEAEVAELEAEITELRAPSSWLIKEVAALRVPVEVLEWEPSSWLPAGTTWDSVVYMADYITRMSDGRLWVTPSAPGAVFPVAEGIDAIAAGLTEATTIWPGYFPGKVPVTALQGGDAIIPVTHAEISYLYEAYEGGRMNEIFREEYAKFGVHLAGNIYWICDNIMTSSVPIYGVDDLKGMAFRSSELVAIVLTEFGAGTVWTPGGEIYTMLATGVVDACTFSGPHDAIAMSFHEVTDYWIREPVALAGACDSLIVNPDVWEALPDDLKAIVEAATEVASTRNYFLAEVEIGKGWAFAEDYGIEIIVWSAEDQAEFYAMTKSVAMEKFTDPACKEYFDIAGRFMVEMGYWD